MCQNNSKRTHEKEVLCYRAYREDRSSKPQTFVSQFKCSPFSGVGITVQASCERPFHAFRSKESVKLAFTNPHWASNVHTKIFLCRLSSDLLSGSWGDDKRVTTVTGRTLTVLREVASTPNLHDTPFTWQEEMIT